MIQVVKPFKFPCTVALLGGMGTWYWQFPGGEVGVRVSPAMIDAIRAQHGFVAMRLRNPTDVLALLQLASQVEIRHLYVPYCPYARQDRVATEGDVVSVAHFAQMLARAGIRELTTVDLHSELAREAMQQHIQVFQLSASQFFETFMQANEKDAGHIPWLVVPDAGAGRRAVEIALRYGAPGLVMCDKEREPVSGRLKNFTVRHCMRLNGHAKAPDPGTRLLVVDDICDGGGTFLGVAQALRQWGLELQSQNPQDLALGNPFTLSLWTTHATYSKGLEDLARRYRLLGCTDSWLDPAAPPVCPEPSRLHITNLFPV